MSASTPPSPSLSARMTNSRYFTETTSVIDQKISDSSPKMLTVRRRRTPWGSVTHSFSA